MKRTKTQNNSLTFRTSSGVIEHPDPIEYYWEIDYHPNDTTSIDLPVFPGLHHDIFIPISGKITDLRQDKELSQSYLSTIFSKSKIIRFHANSRLMGIRIKPIYLSKLIVVKSKELYQGFNPANKILNASLVRQLKKHDESSDLLESADLFTNHFSSAIYSLSKKDEVLINQCIAQITSGNICSVTELAKFSGYSKRWVELKFMEFVGISPKKMIFLTRINRFLKFLHHQEDARLTDLAIKAGYYDQSHLIRDLKNITEKTPKDLREDLPMIHHLTVSE